MGTIYSILPYDAAAHADPAAAVMRTGSHQVAAGFLAYGPATILVSTLGEGTQGVRLRSGEGRLLPGARGGGIPPRPRNMASTSPMCASGTGPMKAYIDDCLAGKDGPRFINELKEEKWRGPTYFDEVTSLDL